jgi:hypothetical protein
VLVVISNTIPEGALWQACAYLWMRMCRGCAWAAAHVLPHPLLLLLLLLAAAGCWVVG